MHEVLENLTSESAFYSRLVSTLFQETVSYKGKTEQIFYLIGEVLTRRKLLINMSADVVTKIELAKVYMKLKELGIMSKKNKLREVDDLFDGEQILSGLAESDIFLKNELKRYTKFAKESKEGRQVFIKLIRHMESQE